MLSYFLNPLAQLFGYFCRTQCNYVNTEETRELFLQKLHRLPAELVSNTTTTIPPQKKSSPAEAYYLYLHKNNINTIMTCTS